MSDGKNGLQLRSLLKKNGELELSLVNVPTAEPGPDEVVVRVEASPINPSDLGLLIGPADMSSAKVSGSRELPVVTARVPEAALAGLPARLGASMRGGHEGARGGLKPGAADAAHAGGAAGGRRLRGPAAPRGSTSRCRSAMKAPAS